MTERKRNHWHLGRDERDEIGRLTASGMSLRRVGACLGRPASTISREVGRNGGRDAYGAARAEERAAQQAARPKPEKISSSPGLAADVELGLMQRWSPEQISRHLKRTYPDTPSMNVSPETIYQSLFFQTRGALRKELSQHLRKKKTTRTSGEKKQAGVVQDMVMISDRPAEAEDRAVPGHWEGDLIMGAANRSAIGTLVERSTRFVMLLHLPNGRSANDVREALTRKIMQLPAHLRLSLTWDQGSEMTQHSRFTISTGIQVYFCNPHSPWQRGTNENTNGLLRADYFPKGDDLSKYTEQELDLVAAQLNGRPRQTLGWRSPFEALNELLP